MSSSTPSTQPSVNPADQLFAALDRRRLGEGSDSWTVSIVGIHDTDRDWWIDVMAEDDESASVVVHMSKHAGAVHAMAALRAWHEAGSSSRPHVLDVMCAA
jgi:hypothetical protein